MTTTTIDAADLTVAHELKMGTLDMGWLSKGLLAAAAKDEVYGVRCHAHIVADQFTAVATATDAYRLHQMHLNLHAPVDPIDVVVPREALAWAAKNVRTFTPKKDSLIEPVAILLITLPVIQDKTTHPGWASVIYREWDDETAPSARFDVPLVKENYPPTERLIDIARTAETSGPAPIVLDHLADARALQTPHTTHPVIQYTAGTGGKQGPALLDFWEGSVLRATALIQPTRTEEDE
ncbi:hypothetical protein [Microbacterium stercoris]|uniref:Uncharacterized protein n=1 Tax=Microbacterium stercoris TaxID=2820289 RepID=A0A939TXJ4_9MICO|nr:hypothetical protein [Microbacterium stercoris]MBO3663707.1 hypothetical protein [Microbacterium stercoris]